MNYRSWRISWRPYLAVTVPVLLYFVPLMVDGRAPIDFGGDFAFYFYPLTEAGMAQWRGGRIPLWTAAVQNGFPLLADGQGALLYPLNLLTYWLLPGPLAHKLVTLLQTLWTAITMYTLARELRLSAMPAVLSAWIWVAVVIFGAQSSPQLNALAWWPLLVWLALRIGARQKPSIYVIVAGLVTGLVWLGGFPQAALYGTILASAFLAYAAVSASPATVTSYLRPAAFWVLGLAFGVGLGGIQLVPTLEMAGQSVRSTGLDYGLASQGSLFPSGLLNYLTPGWSVEGSLSGRLYIGILAIALALLRLKRGMGLLDKFLWVVCGVTLLLAFGKYTPLYYFVSKLPGLSFLRVPVRFSFLTTFCLSLLAARGFEQFICAVSTPAAVDKTLRSIQTRLQIVVVLLVGISLLGGVIARLAQPVLLGLAKQVVQGSLLGTRYRLQGWDYYDAKINSIYAQITNSLSPLNPATLQPVAICLLALLAIWYWQRSQTRAGETPATDPGAQASRLPVTREVSPHLPTLPNPALHPLLRPPAFLLLLMGLEMALLVGNPFGRLSSAEVLAPPKLVQQVQQSAQPSPAMSNRLYELVTQSDVMTSSNPFANLTPNFNLLFGVPHIGASSALGSLRYFDFLGPLGGVNLAYGLPPSTPEALSQDLHVLNLMGARYIVSSQRLTDPRLTALTSDGPYLYLNAAALPRAFIAPKAVTVAPDQAPLLARSPALAPRERVILETDAGVEFPPSSQAPSAEIVEDGDDILKVRTQGAGWLVLTDLYYPGWRARIDGAGTPVYRADGVFRAIALADPGPHLVTFSFEPTSFKHGAWLSLFSLLLVLGFIALSAPSAVTDWLAKLRCRFGK